MTTKLERIEAAARAVVWYWTEAPEGTLFTPTLDALRAALATSEATPETSVGGTKRGPDDCAECDRRARKAAAQGGE